MRGKFPKAQLSTIQNMIYPETNKTDKKFHKKNLQDLKQLQDEKRKEINDKENLKPNVPYKMKEFQNVESKLGKMSLNNNVDNSTKMKKSNSVNRFNKVNTNNTNNNNNHIKVNSNVNQLKNELNSSINNNVNTSIEKVNNNIINNNDNENIYNLYSNNNQNNLDNQGYKIMSKNDYVISNKIIEDDNDKFNSNVNVNNYNTNTKINSNTNNTNNTKSNTKLPNINKHKVINTNTTKKTYNKTNINTNTTNNNNINNKTNLKSKTPRSNEINTLLPKKNKNHLEENKLKATEKTMQAKSTYTNKPQLKDKKEATVEKKTYGKIPDYIQKYKQEAEDKLNEELRKAQESKYPKGTRLISEDERLDTLNSLIKTKTEVETILGKMPISMKTLSMQNRKAELENKLTELESAINQFSKKKVFIKADE